MSPWTCSAGHLASRCTDLVALRDKALFGMEAGLKELECDSMRLLLDGTLKKVGEFSMKVTIVEVEGAIIARRR